MLLTVTEIRQDHGTIVVFDAETEDGRPVGLAVDHRPARDLAQALDLNGPLQVEAEGWQVIG